MVTADEIREVRAELERATDYYLVKEIASRALTLLEEAVEHPAHSGHEYGGAYARAGALAAGDPDWMNATGGTERLDVGSD